MQNAGKEIYYQRRKPAVLREKKQEDFGMRQERILIVVDMQRDFIDGALGTAEAAAIVPAAAEKIRAYRAADYPVIATLDTHGEDYLSTREGRFLPVVHCVKDTAGWQLHPEIAAALGESPRLEKPSFGSMALPARVRELTEVEGDGQGLTIELIGYFTFLHCCLCTMTLSFMCKLVQKFTFLHCYLPYGL